MEYKWTVLSNTTLGALLASLDGTIVLISLPVIFKGLGVDPFLPGSFPILIWLLLGYGVVTATLLVTFGRLSDMWGRARITISGLRSFPRVRCSSSSNHGRGLPGPGRSWGSA